MNTVTLETPGVGGATFGPAGVSDSHRYNLWRRVGPNDRRVLFLTLNPSTATHEQNDPTIRRCIGFAQAWGFGVVEVANIFAYRATDPRDLYWQNWSEGEDPEIIGEHNDAQLVAAALRCEFTVLAWGAHGALDRRGQAVVEMLAPLEVDLRCLKVTRGGQPAHPLYLRADLSPEFFAIP